MPTGDRCPFPVLGRATVPIFLHTQSSQTTAKLERTVRLGPSCQHTPTLGCEPGSLIRKALFTQLPV